MKSNDEYTVFLVDDDVMFLKSIERKLTATTGATVKGFLSGEECLKAMEEETPSLIISDFYLNSCNKEAMNGDKLLRQIKRRHPDVSVIIMSSQENIEIAISTVREGAEDYVVKNSKAVNNLSLLARKLIIKMKSIEYQEENKKIIKTLLTVFVLVSAPIICLLFIASYLVPYFIISLIICSLSLVVVSYAKPSILSKWKFLNIS